MWYVLAGVNVLGALFALVTLVKTLIRYIIAPKMIVYSILRGAGLISVAFAQLYTLFEIPGEWVLKIAALYSWITVLYWAWAVRFSSLKK